MGRKSKLAELEEKLRILRLQQILHEGLIYTALGTISGIALGQELLRFMIKKSIDATACFIFGASMVIFLFWGLIYILLWIKFKFFSKKGGGKE